MSIPLRKLQNSVASEPNGVRIRLEAHLEAQIRLIVREEMREFLLAQRRAAKYIDAAVMQQLSVVDSMTT